MKSTSKCLVALFFAALAAGGKPAWAATYYVATTGNDTASGTSAAPWRTVAKSVNAMVAGDTTYVRGGVYAEGVIRFNKSGTQAAPIKLLNYPGEFPIIDFVNGQAPTFDRILIQHVSGDNRAMGWITIEGFEIRDGYNGIKYHNLHDSVIRRNWLHDNGQSGILGIGSTRVLITQNRVNHNGPFVTDPNSNQTHGIYAHGSALTITNNVIYDNLGYGLQQNGSSTSVYSSTKHAGPEFAGAANWIVANNTFAYNKNRGGMVVWGALCTNARIENNIFYENSVSRSASPQGIEFVGAGGSTGITVRNNHFYTSGSGGTIAMGSNGPADLVSSGNIINVSPPAFVNGGSNALPASPDFRLTAQSPAINKGLNLYAAGVRTDFIGVARPQTGPFEIGAYEYGGTIPPPPSFDFALSNGGNKTLTRGGSVTNSLTASLVSGTAQAVSFSVSGLPSGVTASFSPSSCTPACTTTLNLSASASAALGTAGLTVTAAGAGISRTSAFTLTTQAGNATDLNGDGITNVADVQIAVNQASGAVTCAAGDVNKDGVCNVSDIQLVINKALGL